MRLDVNGNLILGSQTSPAGSNGLWVQNIARIGSGNVYADAQGLTARTGSGNYSIRAYPGGGANALDAIVQFTNAAQNTQWSSIYHRGAAGFYLGSDENVSVFIRVNGTTRLTIDNAGNGYFTGDVYTSFSDVRLKDVKGAIENPLDKLREIDTFYYEANELAISLGAQSGRKIGVSAQSVLKVLPEVVSASPLNKEYLTVQYEKMVPLLIESIKELERIVKDQQEQINQLKGQ
jgi:hypothetical protein